MNSLEEYQNQIELLKQALLFYENENNYSGGMDAALIEIDKGSQARFALEKLKETEELNKKMEQDFETLMKSHGLNEDENIIKFEEQLKSYSLSNDDNKETISWQKLLDEIKKNGK